MKYLTLPLLAMAIMSSAHAEDLRYTYIISTAVPKNWVSIEPLYGDWKDDGAIYGCSNWSPSTSSMGKGVVFEQTATDCKQNEIRTVQPRQQDIRTSEIKNSGPSTSESRISSAISTKSATGILENWTETDPAYTNWADSNLLYGCGSWSPDPATYSATITFNQSSSCSTDQTRQRQDREKEVNSQEVRNSGAPVVENQTLSNQLAIRSYNVVLGEWTASGEIGSCTNWSPDPSTVTLNQSFQQTATDCKQNQTRSRQESYLDHKTHELVIVPKANEQKVATVSSSRSSVGTKSEYLYNSSNMWTCDVYEYVNGPLGPGTPVYRAKAIYGGVTVASFDQMAVCPISNGTSYNGYTVGPKQAGSSFSIKKN